MIYIIDNGRDYSDHKIYFVEAPPDFGAWLVDVMIPWQRREHTYGTVILLAMAESFDWREGKSCSVEEFCSDFSDYFDDEPFPEYNPVPPAWPARPVSPAPKD